MRFARRSSSLRQTEGVFVLLEFWGGVHRHFSAYYG